MKIRVRIYRQVPVKLETSHLSSATFVLPVETAIPPLAEELAMRFLKNVEAPCKALLILLST